MSDRFGRRWPLVINLFLCAGLELGAGFVTTFSQFLALRSLFGVAMGGVWGLASSTALENLPVEVRGLASGVLQQGYACGYLIAAVINLRVVPHTSHSWRALFWASAAISGFAALVRLLVPESAVFLRVKALGRERGLTTGKKSRVFIHQAGAMLKKHWVLCIYAVLLMTGT
jgi:SHS family lactate transporter-like MFS transporter